MFYLKEFTKILKQNLILSFIFFTTTLCLVSIAHHKDVIEQELSLSKKAQTFPYFNALISKDTKLDSVIRRMKQLPGVITVQEGKNKSIAQEIEKLKSTFGADIIKGLSAIHYKKIKIELDMGLREKSHNLIREYLTRLVGKDSVTIGSVKVPKELKLKSRDPLVQFLNWIDVYVFGVLGALWLMSVVLLLKPINTNAFIIEKFQRRRQTNLKIFLSGLIFTLIPVLAINGFSNLNIELFSSIVTVTMIVIITLLTLGISKKQKINYGRS